MAQEVTIENITDVFIDSLDDDMNPRAREVVVSLVQHLHDFCRDVNLTPEEWLVGIDYLTRAGHMTDDKRNEFILICDVLGIESLVDAIGHAATEAETESAVLGPFFREGAPEYDNGETISQRGEKDGPTVLLKGRVTDTDGQPIKDAIINVWETGPEGFYEQQDPDQPDYNLRGQFRTRSDGTYEIRCVKPVSYPIPYDGPAGDILQVTGKHPYRPAHIHMKVEAEGGNFKTLISQLYDREDEYVEDDSVYAVKGSLLVDFQEAGDDLDVDYLVEHDVVLGRKSERAAAE